MKGIGDVAIAVVAILALTGSARGDDVVPTVRMGTAMGASAAVTVVAGVIGTGVAEISDAVGIQVCGSGGLRPVNLVDRRHQLPVLQPDVIPLVLVGTGKVYQFSPGLLR